MFKKATKKQSKLRLALEGASGSGKTYGALELAKTLGKKIAVIDTEHGSASLYSDKFDFDVLELNLPYTPEAYIQGIETAEKMGYDVLIIDSMSHEWNGKGGCLDLVNKLGNNSYTAWGKVTPRHDSFIHAILSSNMHVIATMRSKTAYETGTDSKTNKMTIQKKGTTPIQRESVDYEFTTVFDLNQNHMASVSKDRTGLFDGKDFILDENIGKELLEWLNSGEQVHFTFEEMRTKIEKSKSVKELEELYRLMQKQKFTKEEEGNLIKLSKGLKALFLEKKEEGGKII